MGRLKCRVGRAVFLREFVEIGFKASDKYFVSLMLVHVSNADIYCKNEGLDNVGLRQSGGLW